MNYTIGCLHSEIDCVKFVEDVKNGKIGQQLERLKPSNRNLIRPGMIFVFNERLSKMKRWTDSIPWTTSKVSGCFLTYTDLKGIMIKKTYTSNSERVMNEYHDNKVVDNKVVDNKVMDNKVMDTYHIICYTFFDYKNRNEICPLHSNLYRELENLGFMNLFTIHSSSYRSDFYKSSTQFERYCLDYRTNNFDSLTNLNYSNNNSLCNSNILNSSNILNNSFNSLNDTYLKGNNELVNYKNGYSDQSDYIQYLTNKEHTVLKNLKLEQGEIHKKILYGGGNINTNRKNKNAILNNQSLQQMTLSSLSYLDLIRKYNLYPFLNNSCRAIYHYNTEPIFIPYRNALINSSIRSANPIRSVKRSNILYKNTDRNLSGRNLSGRNLSDRNLPDRNLSNNLPDLLPSRNLLNNSIELNEKKTFHKFPQSSKTFENLKVEKNGMNLNPVDYSSIDIVNESFVKNNYIGDLSELSSLYSSDNNKNSEVYSLLDSTRLSQDYCNDRVNNLQNNEIIDILTGAVYNNDLFRFPSSFQNLSNGEETLQDRNKLGKSGTEDALNENSLDENALDENALDENDCSNGNNQEKVMDLFNF